MEKHTPKLIWRDIVWRPSVAGLGALFAVLPLLTWARDEFLPHEMAERLKLPKLLPSWPLWVWVVIGLSLLTLTILKASSEVIGKYEGEAETQIAKIQARLDEEIAKRGRPEVSVTCDWKLDHSPRTIISSHPKALILKTLTEIAAFDVQVHEIKQSKGTAKFKVISRLDGNSEISPICTIERDDTVFAMWDLHSLVEQSIQAQGLKMSEIEIPIVVDYKDSHGTAWQGVYELRYDPFLDIAQAHLQGFRRKV
jgi:hypothetical protein